MNRIEPMVKRARDEVGVSRHVPITHFNSPTVMESRNGALFSVIRFSGVPFETEKTDTINQYRRTLHRALMALDERFALMGVIHRRRVNVEERGEFTNAFSRAFHREYMSQFEHRSLYVNELYVAVILKGLTLRRKGKITHFFRTLRNRTVKEAREVQREQRIQTLNEAVFQLRTSLSEFGPQVLGSDDESQGYSELLSYVSLTLNGGAALRFKGEPYYSSIEKTFKKTHAAQNIYPRGNVAHYLSTQRIFFGDCIQFQGALPVEARFAAVVSIKRYAAETATIMLDPLLHVDGEFIATHHFLIESKTDADKMLDRQAHKLQNVNDPAVSQIDALSFARDQLASDQLMMGLHYNTVMLLNESKNALEQQIASTIKCYMNAGMVAVRETLGQEAAFWSQIPTNFNYSARSSLITSQNFVDFFPLHNYRTGFVDGNHLGGAMMLIETPSRTPFWLNLHARGPKDNPAPGHTTLIGGNGSGKTVMMSCFDAMLNRYGGSSVFFDRNRGMEIYIRACGGRYTVLSPDHAEEIHLNPLQLPDTPSNRQFCKDWLVQLVKNEEEKEVDSLTVEALHACVDYAFEKLSPEHRTLSHATRLLPINFERWPRLRRWLKGEGPRGEGEYAYLFDHAVDTLSFQTKTGFDFTHFLDHEPPTVLAAVTMVLFHRIEQQIKEVGGALTSIFLDEAWQYLENDYWQVKLKKWLPTLRKMNAHIIFATQSPHSVAHSPIRHTILDNCATNIYFANPQAKPEHYIEGFNLTESEFCAIQENEPQSRLFLIKQGHESLLGRLNLSPVKEYVNILSGTSATVALLTQLRQQVGEDPNDWLPLFLKREKV